MRCALPTASSSSSTVTSTVVDKALNAPLPATVTSALAIAVLSGAKDKAVVVAKGVPVPVELAPGGFQQAPDRFPAILWLLDQLGPRLRRHAELREVQRHRGPLPSGDRQRRSILPPRRPHGNDTRRRASTVVVGLAANSKAGPPGRRQAVRGRRPARDDGKRWKATCRSAAVWRPAVQPAISEHHVYDFWRSSSSRAWLTATAASSRLGATPLRTELPYRVMSHLKTPGGWRRSGWRSGHSGLSRTCGPRGP